MRKNVLYVAETFQNNFKKKKDVCLDIVFSVSNWVLISLLVSKYLWIEKQIVVYLQFWVTYHGIKNKKNVLNNFKTLTDF